MSRVMKLFLALLAAMLLLAACGDDDDTTSPPDQIEDDGSDVAEPEPDDDPIDDDPIDEEDDPTLVDPDIEDPTLADRGDEGFGEDAYILFNANGIETDQAVVSFGDAEDDAMGVLTTYLGEPSSDGGTQPVGPDCLASGDTFRRVLFGDTEVLFVDGLLAFWFTTDPDQNTEAFVGDQTRVSILAGHTTVAQMRESLGEAVIVEDEPPLGPSFFISDNLGEIRGEVTDISDEGIVQSVNSGVGCGE